MKKDVRSIVRKGYAKIAREQTPCCGPANPCCCSPPTAETISRTIGYTEDDIRSVPEGANLGLGCGNPVALASLQEGETVLDLGSGAGFDCFLVADKVGKTGKVIGVDMTPEMLEKARENARKGNYDQVEFRLGEIENLPVADGTVDVVISNCVINLSPDKKRVFAEAYRALRPGGRAMVSDIVLLKNLPDFIKSSAEAYVGCLAGAVLKEDYIQTMTEAGFQNVRIVDESIFPIQYMLSENAVQDIIGEGIPLEEMKTLQSLVLSIKVEGRKQKEN